jgi:hypothetical protein
MHLALVRRSTDADRPAERLLAFQDVATLATASSFRTPTVHGQRRRVMDQRREEAIQNYMENMPTREAFIPAMVDACDLGAMGPRRQELMEVLSGSTFISSFEEKHREALVQLSIEELEALTAFLATQPSSLRTALLKWGAGLAWAGRQVMDSIEGEYDRLVRAESK